MNTKLMIFSYVGGFLLFLFLLVLNYMPTSKSAYKGNLPVIQKTDNPISTSTTEFSQIDDSIERIIPNIERNFLDDSTLFIPLYATKYTDNELRSMIRLFDVNKVYTEDSLRFESYTKYQLMAIMYSQGMFGHYSYLSYRLYGGNSFLSPIYSWDNYSGFEYNSMLYETGIDLDSINWNLFYPADTNMFVW